MNLNDKLIKSLKPTSKTYRMADGRGLYLQVEPNGSKLWRWNYKFSGKQLTLAYGPYPKISLAEARIEHQKAQSLLQKGLDPAQEKKRLKLKRKQSIENTFEAIAIAWLNSRKNHLSKKYSHQLERQLKAYIFPYLGGLEINTIIPTDILTVLKAIEERPAIEVAHRMLCSCKQIFDYAIVYNLALSNPTLGLKAGLSKRHGKHFATIDKKEIPSFLKALENNKPKLFPTTVSAIKLLMLNFTRTVELIGAKWDEFDFERKIWTIPAKRMKMKQDHIVRLSSQSLKIFTELKNNNTKSDWVFPSPHGRLKNISNNTILQGLWRLGYKGKMTGHGFRALAMTTLIEDLKEKPEVIDRQLAHAPKSKVQSAYNRAHYIDERAQMMQNWANYLEKNGGVF